MDGDMSSLIMISLYASTVNKSVMKLWMRGDLNYVSSLLNLVPKMSSPQICFNRIHQSTKYKLSVTKRSNDAGQIWEIRSDYSDTTY